MPTAAMEELHDQRRIDQSGCALLSTENKVYLGVCASSGSNAFCAERNATSSMMIDAVYRVAKIVAV